MDILLVGREQALLQSWRMLLETYFEVKCAGRASEVNALLSAYRFRMVILCETLSDMDRIQVAELVERQAPVPQILAIRAPQNPGNARAVGKPVDVSDGPLVLIRECARVLGSLSAGRKTARRSETNASGDGDLKNIAIA